jgi:hypothetical protein
MNIQPTYRTLGKKDLDHRTSAPASASSGHQEAEQVSPRDERRDGEGMTEFTMRRIRNEIIEECAKVADEEIVSIGAGYGWGAWSEDEYHMATNTATKIAASIRAKIVR